MSSPRSALLLFPAAAAAVALGGCAITDEGPQTTQTRHVGSFTRVDDNASADLRLHVGSPQHVRVRAGDKVIDDVHTEVRGGTLYVTFPHDTIGLGDVVVDASVPRLTAVHSSGSGDVDADGIDASAFDARSEGSGDVTLAGRTDHLALDMQGSGDADASGLAAREARVSVDGSGDAHVRAADRLDVAVDGSGDVRYRGNPAVTQRMDGSGDLNREE
jgi:hypothetical protein